MTVTGPESKPGQTTAVTGPNTHSPGTYSGCWVYSMNWLRDTLLLLSCVVIIWSNKCLSQVILSSQLLNSVQYWHQLDLTGTMYASLQLDSYLAATWTQDDDLLTLLLQYHWSSKQSSMYTWAPHNCFLTAEEVLRPQRCPAVGSPFLILSTGLQISPVCPKFWISIVEHWQLLPINEKRSLLHRHQIHLPAAPTVTNSPNGLSLFLLPQTTYWFLAKALTYLLESNQWEKIAWTWLIFA